MKNTYENFRNTLLETDRGMILNYFGKKYMISHDTDEDHNGDYWYFYDMGNSDKQKFIECEELLNNAKIDGKLLSEIWDDIARSMGSKVKIVLYLGSPHLDSETITEKMGLQPTMTKEHSWIYAAFGEEEYDDLRVYDKTHEFAKIMEGKEDTINKIIEETKYYIITPYLYIIGNPYHYDNYFSISQNFFDLAHKINATIQFRSDYEFFLKGII